MIGGAYCTFCFIGCGASFLYISGNVVINTEFTERRSVAMGIASTGGSVGNILIPLFTSWCIDIYSWRGAFTLLSGLCLQGTIAGFLFYTKDESIGSDYNKAKDTGTFGPCRKKTCLRGFRQSEFQTGVLSYRD